MFILNNSNRYVAVYIVQEKIEVIFFEDFIQGYEWIQEHKTAYIIITFAEEMSQLINAV